MGSLEGPRIDSVLYPRDLLHEASPKAISERTRYHRVCLAFYSYTQLIGQFFIIGPFGPPRPVTVASSWPCVDHIGFASGPCHSVAHLRLGFPAAPCQRHLTLCDIGQLAGSFSKRHAVTRATRPKAAATVLRQLVSAGFQVLFTSLQGFFSSLAHATCSLSVTREYLALEGGPPWFTPGSTCPTLLGVSSVRVCAFLVPGYHRLWPGFPVPL